MAYVYRHIRLDKNCPFYIGIGSDDSYKRAYSNLGRNKFWNNIVKKTNYIVEILVDNISWEMACEKEKEFISIYKRYKEGGTLCNLTLGGEGQLGATPWNFGKETPIETREKQSKKKKGKIPHNKGGKMPEHVKDILRKANIGRAAWNRGKTMSEECRRKNSESKKGVMIGEKHPNWGKKMMPHIKEALRKYWKENPTPFNKSKKLNEEQLAKHIKVREKLMKRVIQKNMDGTVVKIHNSLGSAARELNCSKGTLSNACIKRGRLKTFRGFEWEYESPNK